jgi:hypothetical protein
LKFKFLNKTFEINNIENSSFLQDTIDVFEVMLKLLDVDYTIDIADAYKDNTQESIWIEFSSTNSTIRMQLLFNGFIGKTNEDLIIPSGGVTLFIQDTSYTVTNAFGEYKAKSSIPMHEFDLYLIIEMITDVFKAN